MSLSSRFVGRSAHSLDEKGRLVVPSRYRERLGKSFMMTIGTPDRCLALYPLDAWEAFAKRLEEAPVKNERYRRNLRYIMQHTEEVTPDGQGRFLIPPVLRSYAGITRDVVSVGANTRVEIWAKDLLTADGPSSEDAEAFVTELGLY